MTVGDREEAAATAAKAFDGHDPHSCGNCSPITGECILGCQRWLGECRRSFAVAYQLAQFRTDRKDGDE